MDKASCCNNQNQGGQHFLNNTSLLYKFPRSQRSHTLNLEITLRLMLLLNPFHDSYIHYKIHYQLVEFSPSKYTHVQRLCDFSKALNLVPSPWKVTQYETLPKQAITLQILNIQTSGKTCHSFKRYVTRWSINSLL